MNAQEKIEKPDATTEELSEEEENVINGANVANEVNLSKKICPNR